MITSGNKNKLIADLAMMDLDPKKTYTLEVKEKPKKFSRNAQSYYWALIHKYALWSHKSDTYWHNRIMEGFGEDRTLCGETVWVLLPDGVNYYEDPHNHLKWTNHTREGKDGRLYRWFIQMEDSHNYNSAQFSRLIDGLIEEIQGSAAPIQTMTPNELERLKGYEAAL